MTPKERAMKTALGYFIMKEIKRHELDIIRSWNDIAKLRKQGIEVPDYDSIDPNTWIEA
jgi:hypothetical protein